MGLLVYAVSGHYKSILYALIDYSYSLGAPRELRAREFLPASPRIDGRDAANRELRSLNRTMRVQHHHRENILDACVN